MHFKYLIIGGGIAGFYAAQSIREIDKEGSLAIISQESYLPYDRTVLSKGYLEGKIRRDSIFLKKREYYEKNKIELMLNKKAIELDVEDNKVKLDDGTEIEFEKLLIATGGSPRKLNVEGSDLKGIFYLRSLDDCERIREAYEEAKNIVIVGGGFIGCEAASVFASKGLKVTIIELTEHLLSRVLDQEMSIFIEDFLKSKGVEIFTNTSASRFVGEDGRIKAVETNKGELIPADLALIGIGINPNVELAKQAGIKVENGIVVNEYLETNIQGIYAAGDVAMFYSTIFKKYMRVEHYDVALKQGKVAGKNMAGHRIPFDEVPYFFSYISELKIYVYGELNNQYKNLRRGELDINKGFLKFYFEGDTLNAVLAVNTFKDLQLAKELIKKRALLKDPSLIPKQEIELKLAFS